MTRDEVINLALGHSKYFGGEQSLRNLTGAFLQLHHASLFF